MSVPAQTLAQPAPFEVRTGGAIAAPDSAASEHFRVLLQRLDAIAAMRPMRVVAITSSARREGRTTTAVNLALAAAREGRNVALVECDLRRPTLASMLDLAPRAGLAEVIDGTAELAQALTASGSMSVLVAGAARDPSAALRSTRIASVLDALRAQFQLVILDVPPALTFADAGRLAASADGAVLVVRAGVTPRQVVRMAIDSLSPKLVGLVLNDVDATAAVHGRYLYADPSGG
jgi:capsular exopolysaccharide synthesis family protein